MTIRQVEEKAKESAAGAENAANTARSGVNIVEETIRGMQAIKEKVGLSSIKLQEMGERSNQINSIIETIDDIASQTNMLALNAAIEAARAGESGKGFAVVADEVRKLAERSSTATKEIASLITGIQDTVKEAVAAMEGGTNEVENGVTRANQSSQALDTILEAVETVNQQVTGIATAAQQMGLSAESLVSAMDSVSAVVEQNTAATEEMSAGSANVIESIDSIASVSEENSAAVEEVSAATEEVSAQIDDVSASSQALAEMAYSLQNLVSQFKLTANFIAQPSEVPLDIEQ
jgi:methyl-accepting chemotaxis protein